MEGNDPDLMQDKGVGGRDRESLAEETVSQLEVTGQSVLQADIENWQMTSVHKNNGHSTQATVEGVEQTEQLMIIYKVPYILYGNSVQGCMQYNNIGM